VPIDREEVVWAYRMLLRREPEPTAIDAHSAYHPSRAALVAAIESSEEYKLIHNTFLRWYAVPVFDDAITMWVDSHDLHVSRGCMMGRWEPAETDYIRRHLKPGQGFVDIGANVGWFTLLASTIVGSTGVVHSFEPRPDTGHYLARSIALNRLDDVVTLHRAGLWSEPSELYLIWSALRDNPGGAFLTSEDHGPQNGTRVPLITLDSLGIGRCDLIKMDIEGAEPHALRGGAKTLARFRPPILSELHAVQLRRVSDCSIPDYLRLLADMRYSAYQLGGPDDGRKITASEDFSPELLTSIVFIPDERTDLIPARA
jgi:FkbM family methyltransferase